MKMIHEMKERIGHEIVDMCEKYICTDLGLMHFETLKLACETYNELHDVCETMYDMHLHVDKGITDHLKTK